MAILFEVVEESTGNNKHHNGYSAEDQSAYRGLAGAAKKVAAGAPACRSRAENHQKTADKTPEESGEHGAVFVLFPQGRQKAETEGFGDKNGGKRPAKEDADKKDDLPAPAGLDEPVVFGVSQPEKPGTHVSDARGGADGAVRSVSAKGKPYQQAQQKACRNPAECAGKFHQDPLDKLWRIIGKEKVISKIR